MSSLSENFGQIKRTIGQLEQYGRCENLEIHGIPYSIKENTNEIVRKVAKVLQVNLYDQDI